MTGSWLHLILRSISSRLFFFFFLVFLVLFLYTRKGIYSGMKEGRNGRFSRRGGCIGLREGVWSFLVRCNLLPLLHLALLSPPGSRHRLFLFFFS